MEQTLARDEPVKAGRTVLPRSMVKLGIVCPMANEGDDAVKFCQAVLEQCKGLQKVTFFAVFDRITKDSSLDQMHALEQSEPRLHVVWAPENRSVVDAYLRGYKEALDAGCDWILEIDAGFSHQPSDIPQFFDAMEQGMDCVFGSRFIGRFESSSLKRRFVSWGGTTLANLLLGTSQTDMTSGFEMFSRDTLSTVLDRGIQSRAHFFQTEIKTHCRKLRFVEVPITYRAASPRLGSSALKDAFRQLWRLFQLRLKGTL
ncbi:MAG: glycosyltransferase [Terracidiphilus sp.]|nr:glycosyltransferase [Terracidiphilus sp.]